MTFQNSRLLAAALLSAAAVWPAAAQDYRYGQPPARGWYLNVGAAVLHAPKFEGSRERLFAVQPLISLGRHGNSVRFSSRNDNISFGLLDTGALRAGVVAKPVWGRRGGNAPELAGLDPVKWGLEAGGFAEIYPTDFTRFRAELRRGVRTHDGVIADFALDAFFDVYPTVRLSGGPRATFASSEYFEAHYGVSQSEADASGLSPYNPGGGMKSFGLGGAITWQATDRLTTSAFAEYARLRGPAASSSIVRERGSPNQTTIGLTASYRFDLGR
jgi:MipA family protein